MSYYSGFNYNRITFKGRIKVASIVDSNKKFNVGIKAQNFPSRGLIKTHRCNRYFVSGMYAK
ncbi:MAG: hypothetical protein C0154_11105 [Mucilaginibacter sp.]|nr:MAG: hypothetical protein C0154_11105 [Mucilaginibacter sp.]